MHQLKTDQSVINLMQDTMQATMMQTAMPEPTPPSCAAAAPPARRRLAPQLRIAQILDAALVEFSERGFNAARMDDIASRCGLSKGGLYAHFQSKDEIFKALLNRSLAPPEWQEASPPPLEAGTRPLALIHI